MPPVAFAVASHPPLPSPPPPCVSLDLQNPCTAGPAAPPLQQRNTTLFPLKQAAALEARSVIPRRRLALSRLLLFRRLLLSRLLLCRRLPLVGLDKLLQVVIPPQLPSQLLCKVITVS